MHLIIIATAMHWTINDRKMVVSQSPKFSGNQEVGFQANMISQNITKASNRDW